jgi:hypothetical protein
MTGSNGQMLSSEACTRSCLNYLGLRLYKNTELGLSNVLNNGEIYKL